jgi:hypothetical protein
MYCLYTVYDRIYAVFPFTPYTVFSRDVSYGHLGRSNGKYVLSAKITNGTIAL